MSLRDKENVFLETLYFLVNETGKTQSQCRALIKAMSDDEFYATYMRSGLIEPQKQKRVKQVAASDPVRPKPAPKPPKMKLYSFNAPESLMDELKAVSDETMIPVSALIRASIQQYLKVGKQ